MQTLNKKFESLQSILTGYGKIAVAFSGGVDSALLLEAARLTLGDNVIAVTAASASFPERENLESQDFCSSRGITQIFVYPEQLKIEGFCSNPPDRCYLCKKEIFKEIIAAAMKHGISVICEGSNIDDLSDYRPGLQAIKELGIQSPLQAAELNKSEIRKLSAQLGLPTASKPSFACLATRFAYGDEITDKKLMMVDSAEQLLCDLGFRQYRVRVHGNLARIEVLPDELSRLLSDEIRTRIDTELHTLGFNYVTVDLSGYRSGSMNDSILQISSPTSTQIL